MITVDLTKTELFKSFSEISFDDMYIDLHNEFNCYSIKQLQTQLTLSFKASKNNSRKIQHVEIVFKDVSIRSMNFKIDENNDADWVVDIFYRGRFVDQNEVLSEVSVEGKYYYYLDFYNDYSFELFSNSVIAEFK